MKQTILTLLAEELPFQSNVLGLGLKVARLVLVCLNEGLVVLGNRDRVLSITKLLK